MTYLDHARIRLLRKRGWSVAGICRYFPELHRREIEATIGYRCHGIKIIPDRPRQINARAGFLAAGLQTAIAAGTDSQETQTPAGDAAKG